MRRNSPFPPSTGELAHECGAAVVYVPDQAKLARFRAQGEPPSTMSEEERAAGRSRVAKMMAEFKAGLPPKDEAIWAVGTHWRPGPLGSLIAADLMALMPKEPPPLQTMVEPELDAGDDTPLF